MTGNSTLKLGVVFEVQDGGLRAALRADDQALAALGKAAATAANDLAPLAAEATKAAAATRERTAAATAAAEASAREAAQARAQSEALAAQAREASAAAEAARRRSAATAAAVTGIEREIGQMREQAAALSRATVELDDLTGAYRLNTSEAQVLARTHELLARDAGLSAEQAGRLADDWVGAQAAMQQATAQGQALAASLTQQARDAEAAAAAERERQAAAAQTVAGLEREIGQMREQAAALGRATVELDDLTGAYRVNDSEAQVLARSHQLLAQSADLTAAEADRLAAEWVEANQAMARARGGSEQLARSMTEQAAATDRVEASTDRTTAILGQMRGALAAAGVALGVREVMQYADGWTLANNRLRLATTSSGELAAMQARLFDVSQQTRSGFEATVNLYSRMYQATRDLDVASEDLVGVVTTIQQAFRVSGASAQEAENAVIQLAQGLASGTLRGDEFNSVMEQAPRLASAMSEALGVSRGELREMAAEGKISAETIINALKGQGAIIAAEFGTVQATIGDSLTTASNALQQWIGQTDQAVGASSAIAGSIGFAARNMDLFAGTVVVAAAAIGGLKIAPVFTAGTLSIGRATTAMTAFNAAVRANPIGLAVSLLAAGTAALITWGDEAVDAAEITRRYSDQMDILTGSLDGSRRAQDELTQAVAQNRQMLTAAKELASVEEDMARAEEAVRQTMENIVRSISSFQQSRAPGTSSPLDAIAADLGRMQEAGTDVGRMLDVLDEHIQRLQAQGQLKLSQQLGELAGGIREAASGFSAAQLRALELQATIAALGGEMRMTAAESGQTAKQIETAWGRAGKALADGQREAYEEQLKARGAFDQHLSDLKSLVPAAAAASVAYDPITRQFKAIDRESRVAAKALDLFAASAAKTRDEARQMAEAEIDTLDRLSAEADRASARAAGANARLAASLDLQAMQEQREAIAAATIEWDELAGAYVVVDRQARIAAEALELLRSGAAGGRDEAEAMAAQHVDTADAADRERRALEQLADARSRVRELGREISQMREITAATGRATAEWNDLTRSWELNTREGRILQRTQAELNRNSRIGADEARRLATEWVDAADAQERADQAGQKMVDTLNDQADAAREAADGLRDSFGDAIETILFDGAEDFDRLMEQWTRRGARAALDLATAFAQAQIGSAIGLPSLGGVTIPGVPGGSIALAGQLGSNLIGGTGGLISSGLGVAGGLINGFGNSFGSSALSYGLAQMPQTMVDLGLAQVSTASPFLPGVTYAPSQLGNALAGGINSAGWGVLGSGAMQLLGFEARNPYAGAALNAVGSIGGGALGTLAFGSAFGGPFGAIGGAALSQILASQIGPRPSVGPNAAGHLSAASGRFALGGVGSDNGGDLSGVTQQLNSAASTLNAIMDQLQLSIADSSKIGWGTGLGSGAASPYSATSAEELVRQVLGSGAFASSDPAVQQVLSRSGGSVDPETFMADLQFAAGFTDQLNAWSAAANPAAQATAAAAAEMGALKVQIEEFRSSTERLGLDTAAANEATRQHVEVLFGIREAAEPLGPIATYAANANARLAASADLLAEVGISAEAAAAGVERSIGQMGASLQTQIETQLMAVTGRGAYSEVSAILTETAALARELVAGGQDTTELYQLRDKRLAQTLAGETTEMVAELSAVFGQQLAGADKVELASRAAAAAAAEAEAAATAAAEAAEAEAARATAGADLSAEIEAMLRPAAAAIGAVLDRFETLSTQASDLGLSFDLSEVRARELAGAMGRLDAEGLQEVLGAYTKSADVIEAATAALAGLSTTTQLLAEAEAEASRLRADAIEAETRAASQAADAWQQIAEALDDARAGLRLAPSAALSPQLQLRETEAQYQAALQQALSGDQAAAGQLPELARAMQEAGLAWFGPSSEFYGLQDTIQADLAEAAALAGDQSSIAEQQLAVAEAQLAELQRIAGGGDAAGNALTDFYSLGLAQAGPAGAAAIAQQHSILDRMDPSQLAAALEVTATGGQAQQYIRQQFAGGAQAFDPAADAAARQDFSALGAAFSAGQVGATDAVARQREILARMGPEALMWALGQVQPQGAAAGTIKGFLRDYGVPGFRAGGSAGAGLAWVGEDGPELVSLPRPAEIIDAGTSRRWMDATAAMERGGGDDRVLALLDRMATLLEAQLRGGRAGAESQVAELVQIRLGIEGLLGEAGRAAARPRERVTA